MIRSGIVYVGTATERNSNNFRHGDVFVETDTSQTYIYVGGVWYEMSAAAGTTDWSDITNKPASYPPDPSSTVYDARYYTETETDTLLNTKQPSIIVYYGDSPSSGTNEGDIMYWVNSSGTIRFAVWGATTSGGTLAWRTATLT